MPVCNRPDRGSSFALPRKGVDFRWVLNHERVRKGATRMVSWTMNAIGDIEGPRGAAAHWSSIDWADVLFRLLPWTRLLSVFDPRADNRLDFIGKTRVPSQLSALQRLPDEIPLARRDSGPHELAIALCAFCIGFPR